MSQQPTVRELVRDGDSPAPEAEADGEHACRSSRRGRFSVRLSLIPFRLDSLSAVAGGGTGIVSRLFRELSWSGLGEIAGSSGGEGCRRSRNHVRSTDPFRLGGRRRLGFPVRDDAKGLFQAARLRVPDAKCGVGADGDEVPVRPECQAHDSPAGSQLVAGEGDTLPAALEVEDLDKPPSAGRQQTIITPLAKCSTSRRPVLRISGSGEAETSQRLMPPPKLVTRRRPSGRIAIALKEIPCSLLARPDRPGNDTSVWPVSASHTRISLPPLTMRGPR